MERYTPYGDEDLDYRAGEGRPWQPPGVTTEEEEEEADLAEQVLEDEEGEEGY